MAQTVSRLISERPVRIIQITDLHLCRDPEATLDWGPAGPAVRPQQTLTQVLDEIAYGEPWVDLALISRRSPHPRSTHASAGSWPTPATRFIAWPAITTTPSCFIRRWSARAAARASQCWAIGW
jgi:hypothetical protein